jgi:hypothetical protein
MDGGWLLSSWRCCIWTASRPIIVSAEPLFVLGLLASLLPVRYWRRVERHAPAGESAIASGAVTAAIGLVVGLPAFIAHLSAGAETANGVMVRIAAFQIGHPGGPEITTRFALTASALTAFAFPLTPLGVVSLYLVVTGVLRAVSASLHDPVGDPILTLVDALARRLSYILIGAPARRLQLRRSFGPERPDSILSPHEAGLEAADLVIRSSRPKTGWNEGAVLVSQQLWWFRLLPPIERTSGPYREILYPLRQKKDFGAVTQVVTYEIPYSMLTTIRHSQPESAPIRGCESQAEGHEGCDRGAAPGR